MLDHARVKDMSCFVLLSMRANGVWSQTTPKKFWVKQPKRGWRTRARQP